jgi:hypothetical protein
VESLTDKYLGLPSLVGIDRSDCFQHLIERICQRINGWNEKLLSIGGKEILLKAIAQAIPAYAMSVFNIPKSICKAICNAIAKFWWGGSRTQRKMHWMAWWKMCIPKNEGGMGFRDLHCFNQAMLAKQCWRLLSDPDSLCAQVLRAKYYPDGDLINSVLKKGSSYTWQSIMSGLKTFKRGCIWRPGNGETIDIWADHWVPSSPTRKVVTIRGNQILTRVNELICPITGGWDEDLIRQTFWSVDAERILRIPLPSFGQSDFIAWSLNKSGRFSVKSAYYTEWRHEYRRRVNRSDSSDRSSPHEVWKKIWNTQVPRKIQIFMWRALHGIVPCYCVLANRHIGSSVNCPVCSINAEDIRHMLFSCPRAQEVWQGLGLQENVNAAIVMD